MVKSSLTLQDVIYKEDPCVEDIDKSNELSQYSIPLFNYPNQTVAIGTKCNTYEKKGIIYHWCYLITNNNGRKIGVFEFPAKRYDSFLDEDNEIMTSHLLPHLQLFKDAKKQVIESEYKRNAGKTLGTLEPYKQASLALPHLESIPFSLDMVKPDIELSEMKSQDDYLGIQDIKMLPKNTLVDCLAKCLHKSIDKTESVTKKYLYGILSDHVTLSMFEILKTMFLSIQEKIDNNKTDHKSVKSQLSEVNKKFKQLQEKDSEFQMLLEEIKTLKLKSQQHLVKQKYLQKLLEDKEYMRHIDTLDDFKKFIKSGDYVCEPWTLEILERLMNVKIILLSKNIPQWLVCSRQSPFPHNLSLFNPKYYVIFEFMENDYRVVEYKDANLFTFEMLPLKIKNVVINRCLEKNEGVYANIPLFVKYKQFKLTSEQQNSLQDDTLELEPDKDKIFIGEHLKNFSYPGTVPSERVNFEHVLDSDLVRDKQWREKLGDTYLKPDGRFTLGDKQWASVNHYVTAQPLKQMDPNKYNKMSLSSGSTLSKKAVPYMILDEDDRYSAEFAKFSQNPALKQLLLDTGDAKIYVYLNSRPAIRLTNLEKVRDNLKTNTF